MNKVSDNSIARRWRALLIVVSLLAAFAGSLGPLPLPSTYAAPAAQATSIAQGSLLRNLQLQPQTAPTDDPLPAPYAVTAGRFRYFSQTAHFLRGAFLNYWETHGATPVLGLPITEPLIEDGLTVQYLERARLEWHPEIPDPRGQVLLTRLGAIMSAAQGLVFDPSPQASDSPTSFYFTETGHNLSNAFLSYWQRNGGLAVFGYPISDEFAQVNPADGKTYAVQYFERNRFEWHPENPPAYNVQLGLLGTEYAQMVSLNPLARILLPGFVAEADQDSSDSPQLQDLVDPGLLPAIQALGRTPQFQWVPAVLIKNSIPVQFGDIGEEGVAGALVGSRSRAHPFTIVVPPSERTASLASLASVLAHESTHAFDVTTGVTPTRLSCSIEEELRAYMNGLAAWVLLQGNNALDESYEPQSLDAAVNRSLKGFNSDNGQLDLDFSVQDGRGFLQDLYGSDCGQ